MKKRGVILLFIALVFSGLGCHAQMPEKQVKVSPNVLQQFVGRWYPDKLGWHGYLDLSINEGNLILTMQTTEGLKRFEEVRINEAETSIEWSYSEDIDAIWYLGTWSETNRKEIIVNTNRIVASCGIPTEVYVSHDEATHAKKKWCYLAVLANETLVLNVMSKTDYFSPSGELMFVKSQKNMSSIIYRK